MADTSNLSKFLGDIAEAIRTKKETVDTIPAKDFDTEILSIETGINTSDATATADNIENGYTAYVNGEKISGTITTSLDTIITAGSDATITDTGEALTVDRGYGKKIVLKSEQQLRSTIPYNTLANIAGLTPEKLVKGETVLGVEGTAEGSGSAEINNQDKTITENGTYTADEGYTGLGTVTVNVQAEGIKQFDTIENMQADTTAEEGDLAVVYRRDVQNMNASSVLTSMTFPKTVVLPNPVTSSAYGYIRGDSWESEHRIYLTSTDFSIESEYMFETIVQYSSTDGITYTRGDSYPEIYEFSEPVTFDGTWNDNLGYFIQCEGNSFDGLYQYALAARKDLIQTILIDNLSFDTSAKSLSWNGRYDGPVFDYKKVETLKRKIDDERPASINTDQYNRRYWFTVGEDNEPYICAIVTQDASGHNTTGGIGVYPLIDTDGSIVGTSYGNLSPTGSNLWVHKLDLENMTYSDPVIYTPTGTAPKCYWNFKVKIVSFQVDYEYNGHYDWYMSSIGVAYVGTGSSSSKYTTSFTGSLYPDGYVMAKSQLTLMSENELLPGKTAIGKEKVLTGDGSIYGNLDWNLVLSDILNLTPNSEATTTAHYGPIPNKFISNIKDTGKMHFVKNKPLSEKPEYYIGEVTYESPEIVPTAVCQKISSYYYNKWHNMIISFQYTYDSTNSTYDRRIIIEDATTHEILANFTNSNNESYEGMSKHAIYTVFGQNSSSTGVKHYVYAYNLSSLSKHTIMNKSYAYNSAYGYTWERFVIGNRYMTCYSSYQTKNYGTAYYYGYVYDDERGTTITLANGLSSSISYTNYPAMSSYNADDYLYVLCSMGYFGNRAMLYKITKSSFTSTKLWDTTSGATDETTNINTGYDIDDNYILWGEYLVSKKSASDLGQNHYYLYDTDGNLIVKVFGANQRAMFMVDGKKYIALNDTIYEFSSYTINNNTVDIIVTNSYEMPYAVALKYININGSLTNVRPTYEYTTMKVNDTNYTVDFYNDISYGNINFLPVDYCTSQDYHYSVIYGGNDIFVMTPCNTFNKDYTGTINPTEYNTALDTSIEILGEEV